MLSYSTVWRWHFYHLAYLPMTFLPSGIFTYGIFTIWHFYLWQSYLWHFYQWHFYRTPHNFQFHCPDLSFDDMVNLGFCEISNFLPEPSPVCTFRVGIYIQSRLIVDFVNICLKNILFNPVFSLSFYSTTR